jgi:hypothetical protein
MLGGTIPRAQVYAGWLKQECLSHGHETQWGVLGYPYRANVSSGDEAGSIGCSQVLSRYKYNANSANDCPDLKDLNLYSPEDSIRAMEVFGDADYVPQNKNCGRSFSIAFNTPDGIKNPYDVPFVNDGTDPGIADVDADIRLVQASGATATGNPVSVALGDAYSPDTDELLSKAFMGYNAGEPAPAHKSWPSFLAAINPETGTSSGDGVGVKYAILIKGDQRANIPYREYLWRIPNPNAADAVKNPYVCFQYGEAEWIHAAEYPTASDSYSFAGYVAAVNAGTIKSQPCPGST